MSGGIGGEVGAAHRPCARRRARRGRDQLSQVGSRRSELVGPVGIQILDLGNDFELSVDVGGVSGTDVLGR